MFRAMRALLAARFDDAERLAAAALAIGEAHGNPNALVAYGSQVYVMRWGQGRLEEIAPLLDEFVARHASGPVWESAAANLHATLGRLDEARRRFEPACDAFLTMPRDVTWLPHLGLLAESCARIGDRTRAATLYGLLEPFAGQHLVTGPGAACLGAAGRPAGLLAALLGRHDEALALLDQALDGNERMGALAWVAQTLSDRAAVLLAREARGDREAASACVARARALAARLDLRGVTAAVEALAERLGGEPDAVEDAASRQVLRHEGDHWTASTAAGRCTCGIRRHPAARAPRPSRSRVPRRRARGGRGWQAGRARPRRRAHGGIGTPSGERHASDPRAPGARDGGASRARRAPRAHGTHRHPVLVPSRPAHSRGLGPAWRPSRVTPALSRAAGQRRNV
jgi:tetratricopeptide (TPR) repeat protein